MSFFLFLLGSGVGCDLCLWLFLDFSVYILDDDPDTDHPFSAAPVPGLSSPVVEDFVSSD